MDEIFNATTLWIEDFLLQFRTFVQKRIETFQGKTLHVFINFVILGFLAFFHKVLFQTSGRKNIQNSLLSVYFIALYCHFLKMSLFLHFSSTYMH